MEVTAAEALPTAHAAAAAEVTALLAVANTVAATALVHLDTVHTSGDVRIRGGQGMGIATHLPLHPLEIQDEAHIFRPLLQWINSLDTLTACTAFIQMRSILVACPY